MRKGGQMIYMIYGALGVLGVLALLGGGFAAGWVGRRLWQTRNDRGAAEERSEEERRAVQEEQKAFEGMLSYNTDIAYGITSLPEENMGGEHE